MVSHLKRQKFNFNFAATTPSKGGEATLPRKYIRDFLGASILLSSAT